MILVTGSTGLLGGHVLHEILRINDRVAALKRASAPMDTAREIFSHYNADPDRLMERIDWRTGDMLDRESLEKALEGITAVVNCAAIVSFSPRDRKVLVANNVLGTKNLADAVRNKEDDPDGRTGKVRILLVHVSSTSALGDGPGNDPGFLIDEETPRDPGRHRTGYSVSKYESEQVLRATDLEVVCLNPGIILGPGQWGRGSSKLFVKAWQGLNYYPYGGTGYVDVRDVASIISAICSQAPGVDMRQRYCLVGANLRYREFFNLVSDEFGKPNPRFYAGKNLTGLAWRADAVRSWVTGHDPLLTRETANASQRISFYSSAKIMEALSFRFRPIRETIAWVAGCYLKKIGRS